MSGRWRLAVALAIVPLALGLAELVARVMIVPDQDLVWRPLPPFDGLYTAEQRSWLERQQREIEGAPATGVGSFDPELGWTNRNDSASVDRRVHIDARGRRTRRAYPAERAPSSLRIVACGDSFTFCEEVADAEAWPARLEDLVPGSEVWNLGVGGYGTDQALLRARRELSPADGPLDALLCGILIENIGRNVNRYRPRWHPSSVPAVKPRFLVADGGDGLELVPQPYATREAFVADVRSGAVLGRLAEHEYWTESFLPAGLEWSAVARLLGARRAYAARDLAPLWSDTADEPFRTTVALVAAFGDLARELGARRWVVLVFPTRESMEGLLAGGERYWSTLGDALAARGIEVLDLTDALLEEARRDGLAPLFLRAHLSPRGNEIVASAVHRWLAP
jgi:hypothetical protein